MNHPDIAAIRATGRARRAAAGMLSLTALTLLLGGLPAALYAVGGSPVPRAWPAWHQVAATLARPDGGTLFLAAVRWASWLAWALFAVSALVDGWCQVRGRAGSWLPVIGPARALAAALAGTAVLGLLPALHLPRPAPPGPAGHALAVAAAPPRPGPRSRAAAAPARADAGPDAAASCLLPGVRGEAYRVVAGDNLWDIAVTHLGDGGRWREIFVLNRERPQPGGQRLTDPNLIDPGWVLLLPPRSAAAQNHAPPAGPRRAPGQRCSPPGGQPAPARGPRGGHAGHRPEHAPGIRLPGGGLVPIALATAISAAAVLAGIQRRRRYRPGTAATSSLRPGGPPEPAVIAALRRAARTAPGKPAARHPALPVSPHRSGPYRSGPYRSRPYQADPDLEPRSTAPHRRGQGRPGSVPGQPPRRTARSPAGSPPLPGHPAAAAGPQPPGVIGLGVRDGTEIAADVAVLGGLGLTGPGAPAAARAILAGLLARAVPGQPGGPAEVIVPAADAAWLLPGWHRDDVSGTGLPGLVITSSLDAALDRAEALIVRRARMSGAQDTGDDPQDSSPALPAVALIASPARAAARRLRAVLESGRGTGVAGILLGDWSAGTTCQVAADGTVTSADRSLDGIRLFTLGTAGTAAVISLLREACGPPPANSAPRRSPAARRRPGTPAGTPARPGTPPPASRRQHPALRAARIRRPASRRTRPRRPPAAPAPPGRARRRARRCRPAPPPARTRPWAGPHGQHAPNPAPRVTPAARARTGTHQPPRPGESSGWKFSARCGSPPGDRRSAAGCASPASWPPSSPSTPAGSPGRRSARPCGPDRLPAAAPPSATSRCASSATCSAQPPA